LIVRATTFRANPRIKRVVFICTPHRGSDLASNGIGKIGISLITLPTRLTAVMLDSLTGADLTQITGSSKRLPNSITGLKPTSPALPVINSVPINIPYHSIIGDRGKDHCPNCSDGVVAYWSSHLDGAQSEKIAARLRINPEFANKVYDTIEPGTTVIITDQPVVRSRGNAAILEG
jgi:hypothetical protein